MNISVIHEGEDMLVDLPFLMEQEWVIPKGWYLLNNILDLNTSSILKNNKPIIVIENIQILNQIEGRKEIKLSIIKTDKKLKRGDIIKIK